MYELRVMLKFGLKVGFLARDAVLNPAPLSESSIEAQCVTPNPRPMLNAYCIYGRVSRTVTKRFHFFRKLNGDIASFLRIALGTNLYFLFFFF